MSRYIRYIRHPVDKDLVLINGRWEEDPGIACARLLTRPTAAEDVTDDIGGARKTAAEANGILPVADVTHDIGSARAAAARANDVQPVARLSHFGAQAAAMRGRIA